MTEEFVTVKGYKFYVKDDLLDLHNKGIKDITEIEGLEKPTNLKALYLSRNQIEEINGLEQLTKLQILDLSGNKIKVIKGLEKLTGLKELYLNHNQLEEIKGLETLTNLEKLRLDENPIREDEKHLIDKSAQEVVKYCQEKARKKANDSG